MRAQTWGVQLARVQPPLLARVAAEERLIELAPDLGDDRVLRGPCPLDRFGAGVVERLDLVVGAQVQAGEGVERRAVNRHRLVAAAYFLHHGMRIRVPSREAR